jgi:SAM-dependent methyltransferase
MRLIGEFLFSFGTFFKVKWFLLKERREIRRSFPAFLSYERSFDRAYRYHNPFKICKEYLEKKGEECTDAYGETPLPALAKIARECDLKREDLLIELGCGRGRGAFFLSHFVGCSVIGIDWVPFFISTAHAIAKEGDPPLPVAFRCMEMQHMDFAHATAIFLYGTCLSDARIHALIARFETLPSWVKIITISYPLSDYSPLFQTLKQFSVLFPWGEGEVFMNSLSGEVYRT